MCSTALQYRKPLVNEKHIGNGPFVWYGAPFTHVRLTLVGVGRGPKALRSTSTKT